MRVMVIVKANKNRLLVDSGAPLRPSVLAGTSATSLPMT